MLFIFISVFSVYFLIKIKRPFVSLRGERPYFRGSTLVEPLPGAGTPLKYFNGITEYAYKISTYLLPGAISKQLHTVKRLSADDLFSLAAIAVLLIPFIAFIYGINKIICSRVPKVKGTSGDDQALSAVIVAKTKNIQPKSHPVMVA